MKKFTTILILTVLTTAFVSTVITFTLFQKLSADLVPAQQENFEANFVKNRINIKPNLLPTDFVETSAKVRPAIVSIRSKRGEFGGGNGSGVIISEDGYIVTNYHVIADTDSFEVTTNDKKIFKAKIIGSDPTTDLALIKIDATDLPTATFGNSDAVKVGEWVLAVGNPFNLTSTVTLGIVSAKSRNINILSSEQYSVESFIQTDAVVNPGNSGGGLVNANGLLVGINAAILTETGSYEGYSFAIPSNLVKKVIGDLKDFGEVKRAILGVTIENVNEEVAKKNNLSKPSGVRIDQVNDRSSAAEAGFKKGDIIISVNGAETNSTSELQEKVARFRPGDIVSIEFIRNGKLQKNDKVTLKGIN